MSLVALLDEYRLAQQMQFDTESFLAYVKLATGECAPAFRMPTMTSHDPASQLANAVVLSASRLALVICTVAIGCEIFLVWADYDLNYSRGTSFGPLRRFFNIAREDGAASWFGVTQTMLIALTLCALHLGSRARPGATRLQRRGWLVLALFFAYMAFDDGTQFHERMGSVWGRVRAQVVTDDGPAGWATSLAALFPSYDWQFLFLPLFGAFGLFMLVFLWRELDTRGARGALLASIGLLACAIALDFVEGLPRAHPWNVIAAWSRDAGWKAFALEQFGRSGFDALRHFAKSLEEFVEMLAQTILWAALITRLDGYSFFFRR